MISQHVSTFLWVIIKDTVHQLDMYKIYSKTELFLKSRINDL